MTLKEMLAALAAKKSAGKTALAALNALSAKDPATLTAEETAKLAALEAELTGLESDVEALQAQVDAEQKKAKRGTLFATTTMVPARSTARTVNEVNPEETFGFRSLTDFARSVMNAQIGVGSDPRLAAALEANAPSTYNQNQGGSGEGYLVPPQFSTQIWDMALDNTDLFGMAAPEPTTSNAVFKPKDESTPWGAVGVQAYWAAEAGQLSPSKFNMSGELAPLHKLYAFVGATDELLADAPLLQNRLTVQAGRAMRWKLSDAVMWGTGAGQLTGFMNAPSLVTVSKESGQATNTLVVANILKMSARMLRLGGKPFWIANADIIPQLGALTIGNSPAYLPYQQPLASSPFEGTLQGHPVAFTEHAQTLGTAGDLVLANLDGYWAINKEGGVDFASSIHLYFDQGIQAFRWTFRANGMPYLSKPVSPARGSTTKSHFVALQSRP